MSQFPQIPQCRLEIYLKKNFDDDENTCCLIKIVEKTKVRIVGQTNKRKNIVRPPFLYLPGSTRFNISFA